MPVLAVLIQAAATAPMPPARYREGQVWSYHARPGDEGSLLKIQRVEQLDGRPVYHITVIGFHLRASDALGIIQHEPVSKETLDRSVVAAQPDPGTFPSADDGIAQWRQAHGGVYTVTVAETVELIDRTLAGQAGQPREPQSF